MSQTSRTALCVADVTDSAAHGKYRISGATRDRGCAQALQIVQVVTDAGGLREPNLPTRAAFVQGASDAPVDFVMAACFDDAGPRGPARCLTA